MAGSARLGGTETAPSCHSACQHARLQHRFHTAPPQPRRPVPQARGLQWLQVAAAGPWTVHWPLSLGAVPSSVGNVFRDPQRRPETKDSTKTRHTVCTPGRV